MNNAVDPWLMLRISGSGADARLAWVFNDSSPPENMTEPRRLDKGTAYLNDWPKSKAWDQLRAGAVIGPEVVVFEGLAHRFGVYLASEIAGGTSVGAALLEFRRQLLQDLNPLGFALTAYGSADLSTGKQMAKVMS